MPGWGARGARWGWKVEGAGWEGGTWGCSSPPRAVGSKAGSGHTVGGGGSGGSIRRGTGPVRVRACEPGRSLGAGSLAPGARRDSACRGPGWPAGAAGKGMGVQCCPGYGWDWVSGAPSPQPPGRPPRPHLRPAALPGPSGFHQVSQQSGCDIMRQAGVSGVTSCGPDVWKSPNQNDPKDGLESRLSKRALQSPENTSGQALSITASRRQ